MSSFSKKEGKKHLMKNILLMAISPLIFLCLGEFVTRIFYGSPLLMKPDEVLYWRFAKDQCGYFKMYYYNAKIDENGFRFSGKEFNSNLSSIYIGGDSYAWGSGVADTQTVAGQMCRIFQRYDKEYNFLNGGVPGYGVGQILDRMEMECQKFRPKYAVLLWVETDLNRMRNISDEEKRKFLRAYKIRSIFRYSAFLKLIKEQLFDKLLQADIGFGWHKDVTVEYAKTHTFYEKTREITPKIINNVNTLKNLNITAIWVFMTIPSKEFRNYIENLAQDYSVTLIDPVPLYKEKFPDFKNMENEFGDHFNSDVHNIVATAISEKIFELEKISKSSSF